MHRPIALGLRRQDRAPDRNDRERNGYDREDRFGVGVSFHFDYTPVAASPEYLDTLGARKAWSAAAGSD